MSAGIIVRHATAARCLRRRARCRPFRQRGGERTRRAARPGACRRGVACRSGRGDDHRGGGRRRRRGRSGRPRAGAPTSLGVGRVRSPGGHHRSRGRSLDRGAVRQYWPGTKARLGSHDRDHRDVGASGDDGGRPGNNGTRGHGAAGPSDHGAHTGDDASHGPSNRPTVGRTGAPAPRASAAGTDVTAADERVAVAALTRAIASSGVPRRRRCRCRRRTSPRWGCCGSSWRARSRRRPISRRGRSSCW